MVSIMSKDSIDGILKTLVSAVPAIKTDLFYNSQITEPYLKEHPIGKAGEYIYHSKNGPIVIEKSCNIEGHEYLVENGEVYKVLQGTKVTHEGVFGRDGSKYVAWSTYGIGLITFCVCGYCLFKAKASSDS